MKRFILILFTVVLAALGVCLAVTASLRPVVSAAFGEIPVADSVSAARLEAEAAGSFLPLSAALCGLETDVLEDGTVLVPVFSTEDIAVRAPRGATLTRTEIMEENGLKHCLVFAEKGGKTGMLRLTETGIASARLTTGVPDADSEEPFGEEKTLAEFTLFSPQNGRIKAERGYVKVNIRGASSLEYSKKSYTLTCVSENAETTARSLYGFPPDTKFALNSMFEDDLKLRDILSLELFRDIAGENAPHLSMKYTELTVNGRYWGLYGFQQTATAAALGLAPSDGLHKFAVNIPVSFRKLLVETRQDDKAGTYTGRLKTALTQMNNGTPGFEQAFDEESAVNYAVFLAVAAAGDNTSKNLLIVSDAASGKMKFAAYDCDLTFGLRWKKDVNELNVFFDAGFAESDPLSPAQNYLRPVSLLCGQADSPFRAAFLARYRELRGTLLTNDALFARMDALYATVKNSGALLREKARRPDGAASESTDAVKAFLAKRMAWLDETTGNGGM